MTKTQLEQLKFGQWIELEDGSQWMVIAATQNTAAIVNTTDFKMIKTTSIKRTVKGDHRSAEIFVNSILEGVDHE